MVNVELSAGNINPAGSALSSMLTGFARNREARNRDDIAFTNLTIAPRRTACCINRKRMRAPTGG
jgi:hypothetical protein